MMVLLLTWGSWIKVTHFVNIQGKIKVQKSMFGPFPHKHALYLLYPLSPNIELKTEVENEFVKWNLQINSHFIYAAR